MKRFFLILFFTIFSVSAHAQSISVTRELDFGEAVVTENDAQYEIVVLPGGGYTSDPEFVFVDLPLSGIYRLTGADPNRGIASVTVTVDQQLLGGGQQFTIDNFNANFPATTDGAGEATITLGARIRTTGSGMAYVSNTDFNAILTMTITFI